MKRSKKLGSKLIALMLALMMVAAYVPMVENVAYADTNNSQNYLELYTDASATETTDEYTWNPLGTSVYIRAAYPQSSNTDWNYPWIGIYEGEYDVDSWEQMTAIEWAYVDITWAQQDTGKYDGENAVDIMARGNNQAVSSTHLDPGTYTVILFNNEKTYEPRLAKQFEITRSGVINPNAIEDEYPEYSITLVPEESYEQPVEELGMALYDAYIGGEDSELNIKVTAPEGASEDMWIAICDYNWNTRAHLAWQYVNGNDHNYAGTTIQNSETFNLKEVWADSNANDNGEYANGIRKLVLYKDGGHTVVDTKFFRVCSDASGTEITLSDDEFVYNGSVQQPEITVAGNLAHEVVMPESINVGDNYEVIVKFKGAVTGRTTAEYKIVPKELVADDITVVANKKYNGEAVTAVVKDGAVVLEEGKDYAATYADNDKAGEATVVIEFKGNYAGEVTKTFNIECEHKWVDGEVKTEPTCSTEGVRELVCEYGCGATDTATIEIDADAHAWDEGVVTKAATCSAEGVKTFTCQNNDAHTDTKPVVIHADAHAWDEGVVTKAATCSAEGVKTFTCQNNDAHTNTEVINVDPAGHKMTKTDAKAPTCTEDGNIEYYTCSVCNKIYEDEKGSKDAISAVETIVDSIGHNFGEYVTTTKAGFGTEGEKTAACTNENCQAADTLAIAAVAVPAIKDQTFNNKKKTPKVTVVDTEGNAVEAKPTFANKTRKSVGKYKVTVELTGADYEGSKDIYFKINPAGKSISKLSKGKKSFTVKWKKASTTYRKQMTGYQIKYSTSSKMTKAKTVTVKSTKATSKTIKKLKAKKYYYVQLRTYKTVKGDKYYSSWSKVKKVRTK